MKREHETPRPPETAEFGHVAQGGPAHSYPQQGCASIRKVSVGGFDNNVYILSCTSTGETLIVDGAAEPERLFSEVGDARVVGIVQTHGHGDHVQALPTLVEAWGCPVYAHPDDRYPVEITPVSDGDRVAFGGAALDVLHTPGHTPGSLSFLLGSQLFSGDTLFPGGPGATGGDAERFAEVMRSLDRLFLMDDHVRVCPGHGLDTTIGRERPYVDVWRARGW